METRSRLARNHVLLLKICTIDLIIILKVREDFHFIELCILILNFTLHGLYGVTIRFDETIKSFGFYQSIDEACVYKLRKEKSAVFLVLYVDDILLIGDNVKLLTEVKYWLATQLKIKRSWKCQLYPRNSDSKGQEE